MAKSPTARRESSQPGQGPQDSRFPPSQSGGPPLTDALTGEAYQGPYQPMDISQALMHYAAALEEKNPGRAQHMRNLAGYAAYLVEPK